MPTLTDNITKETKEITNEVEKTSGDMINNFSSIVSYLNQWYNDYKKPIDKTTNENEKLAESVEKLIQKYNNLDKQKDIVINVTSPQVNALDATLSGITEKIQKINETNITPKYDGDAFKELDYDNRKKASSRCLFHIFRVKAFP